MIFFSMVMAAAGLGFLVGATRPWFRRAPIIVSGLVVLAYGGVLTYAAIWAAQCWRCRVGTEDDRSFVFIFGFVFLGAVAFSSLAGIWTGAWLANVVAKRMSAGRHT